MSKTEAWFIIVYVISIWEFAKWFWKWYGNRNSKPTTNGGKEVINERRN